jgi:arylsulfatase A-like enzyme
MASFDFYATAASAAGKEAPAKCDGVDLVRYLSGDGQEDAHKEIYWCNHKKPAPTFKAMRWKQWRLAQYGGEVHLFDINADPQELKNLAPENPEIVKDMSKRWQHWYDKLGPMGVVQSSGGQQPKGYGWATLDD